MSEQEQQQKGLARIGNTGIELRNFADLWRFADVVAKSGLAPKGMERIETICTAIQLGLEVGLPPMAALQNIAVINGRPSIWGDAMLAVCRGSGLFDEEAFVEDISESNDQIHAACTVRRLPDGKPVTRRFSVDDAKRAALWGKQGPWQQYPQRMLQLRARSWALRDAFADVLRGMHAAEEVRDMPPKHVEARVVEPANVADDLASRIEKQMKPEAAPDPQPAAPIAAAPTPELFPDPRDEEVLQPETSRPAESSAPTPQETPQAPSTTAPADDALADAKLRLWSAWLRWYDSKDLVEGKGRKTYEPTRKKELAELAQREIKKPLSLCDAADLANLTVVIEQMIEEGF